MLASAVLVTSKQTLACFHAQSSSSSGRGPLVKISWSRDIAAASSRPRRSTFARPDFDTNIAEADKAISPVDLGNTSRQQLPHRGLNDTAVLGPSISPSLPAAPPPTVPVSSNLQSRKNYHHDSRRGGLVKFRVAPRRYRLRKSFDQPRRLNVKPSDPQFAARISNELSSIDGPRQLTAIITKYGPYLSAAHCALAISLLAGLVTGKQLSQQQLSTIYQAPATTVAEVLTGKIRQASLLDCARAVYGLARLQLHLPRLLSAVKDVSQGMLSEATPQVLSGLAFGLATWGCTPDDAWLDELCVESFVQIDSFSAQKSCSQPFLQRCLSAFRGHWGSSACHAPALVRFIYAVSQLPPCQPLPDGMRATWPGADPPVYQHHDQFRQQRQLQAMGRVIGLGSDTNGSIDSSSGWPSTSRESGQPGSQAQHGGDQPIAGSSRPLSRAASRSLKGRRTAADTYRIPSFNWLVAFLVECRRQVDVMKPVELSTLLWSMARLNHAPDLIFMECWYRTCAAHMHAFTPQTLAVSLQALGMLRPGAEVPGAVSGRWLKLALQRSGELLAESSGAELSHMLWGFAELHYWPGLSWMEAWLTALQQELPSMTAMDIADVVWGLARMRYAPPEHWVHALKVTISGKLADFGAQDLAVVIWGCSRLGIKPDRAWLLAFKSLSNAKYDDASAQQLAQFIAGVLAQQNRIRFGRGASGSSKARGEAGEGVGQI
eukprot:gene5237-5472_t